MAALNKLVEKEVDTDERREMLANVGLVMPQLETTLARFEEAGLGKYVLPEVQKKYMLRLGKLAGKINEERVLAIEAERSREDADQAAANLADARGQNASEEELEIARLEVEAAEVTAIKAQTRLTLSRKSRLTQMNVPALKRLRLWRLFFRDDELEVNSSVVRHRFCHFLGGEMHTGRHPEPSSVAQGKSATKMTQEQCKVQCQRFGMKRMGEEFKDITRPQECAAKCEEAWAPRMLRADAGPVATVMELRKTKELGIHAVARCSIHPDDLIISEQALLRLPPPSAEAQRLLRGFGELGGFLAPALCAPWATTSAEQREACLQLFYAHPGSEKRSQGTHLAACAELLRCWAPLKHSNWTPEELLHFLHIVDLNIHKDDERPQNSEFTGIFVFGSKFSHSCAPNAAWSFDREGRLQYRALCPIAEGDVLTFSYVGNGMNLITSTLLRRERLSALCFGDPSSAREDAERLWQLRQKAAAVLSKNHWTWFLATFAWLQKCLLCLRNAPIVAFSERDLCTASTEAARWLESAAPENMEQRLCALFLAARLAQHLGTLTLPIGQTFGCVVYA
eukprot:g13756.t1